MVGDNIKFDEGELQFFTNYESERIVLSVLMNERSLDEKLKIIEKLKPEYFHRKVNRKIFSAIVSLTVSDSDFDLVTIYEKLLSDDDLSSAGGMDYLFEISESFFTSAFIDKHVEILVDKFKLRAAVEIFRKTERDIKSGKSAKYVFDGVIDRISEIVDRGDFGVLDKNFLKFRIDLMRNRKEGGDFGYFPKSGYEKLDSLLLHGFRPGLVIIAGRPGMGKTDFKINLMHHWLMIGCGVYDWSPEMGAAAELDRLDLIKFPDIEEKKLYRAEVKREDAERLKENWRFYDNSNFVVDCDSSVSLSELLLRIKFKSSNWGDRKIAVLDSFSNILDAIQATYDKRSVYDSIIQQIFNFAKREEICFVVVHHLGKVVDRRKGRKFYLADLMETTGFERTADLIFFIYRPVVYDEDVLDDTTHIVIGKQRDKGSSVGKGVRLKLVGSHRYEEVGFIDEHVLESEI